MSGPPAARGKVILDTNIFIDYLRKGWHADWVAGRVEGTVRFLSAVVLLELRLGADAPRRRRAVDRIRAAFPGSRVIAPGPELFDRAGRLFRRIHGGLGEGSDRLGPMNDLLIALTAWRIGASLVTANADDFERIRLELPGFSWLRP